MLVETVALLFYCLLPTKWVGKGYRDPFTLPTSLPNSFGLRVSSISPPLSGHYRAGCDKCFLEGPLGRRERVQRTEPRHSPAAELLLFPSNTATSPKNE